MTLLRHRDFRRLWAGDSLSQFGIMTTALAMPLLAVRTLHATPLQVGLLTTFEYLAFLVIGLPTGAWVDRMRRRNVMIAADLGRAALLGWVPLAAALGVLNLVQVYAVVFAVGCLTVFFDVSYQSYLPFLVGREHLVEGNATLQGTQSVAQLAGPSLGGLLVQVLTAPYAILANVGTFLWSASWVGTIRVREPRPERTPERNLLREVREGVAFIVRHPVLRHVAAATGTANLWSSAAQGMVIVLLARTLDLSAGVIGLLMAAGAAGGLLGAFGARPLARRLGEGPVTWLSLAVASPEPGPAVSAPRLDTRAVRRGTDRLLRRNRHLQRDPGQLPSAVVPAEPPWPDERQHAISGLGHHAARRTPRRLPRLEPRSPAHPADRGHRAEPGLPVGLLLAAALAA